VIAVLALMAAAAAQPQAVLTIDPKHRLVEGVASDGATIWVSSIFDRQVLACTASCRAIATLPKGLHPFAIAWDASRKRLWVAADCPPGVPGITACERGALIGLDARGRVQTRIAPASGSFHPGDVSTSADGVFVSDSQNGAVYRLAKTGYSLSTVVAPGVGKSAQGTALDTDGKTLLVADYSEGLAAVDLASGSRKLVRGQDGKSLRGIDGLARCGASYFGIYNGSTPGRLLWFQLNGEGAEYSDLISGLRLPDPTQIAFDGKRLLIVADSGWASVDKPDVPRTSGATIVAVPLSADCQSA
jgi:sugar lactone lactonase YvrE